MVPKISKFIQKLDSDQYVKEMYGLSFYFQITCLRLLHFHIGFLRSSCVFLNCGKEIAKEVQKGACRLSGIVLHLRVKEA